MNKGLPIGVLKLEADGDRRRAKVPAHTHVQETAKDTPTARRCVRFVEGSAVLESPPVVAGNTMVILSGRAVAKGDARPESGYPSYPVSLPRAESPPAIRKTLGKKKTAWKKKGKGIHNAKETPQTKQ